MTVHGRFEAQVRRTPDAIAVEYEGQRLTYAELNARANGVARYLRERGVGPEVLVALALERSPDALVALLGVLKAGGAYVPVDPRYPAARRSFMLQDSGAAIVLDGDGSWPRDLTGPANPDVPVHPDNLAYVIYTSGSTGRPKGVAIPHRGLCNLADDQIARWGCGPGSRVMQFASLSFDACFTEIAVALLSGATLCMAPQERLMPGVELHRTLRRLRVTALKTPPSVLANTPAHDLPDLGLVVNGGGPCHPDLMARWSHGRTFLNAYGATECSVCSSTTAPLRAGDRIALGEPVRGAALRVLDPEALEPAPRGELFIAGAGVGRGYWGRPDLTAERYLPDPFGEQGARMYRTGDVVRLAGGQLEYVGRVDHQVKVRGFRVELGEVERAMVAHPAVLEAVAGVSGADGEERLVAHLVLDESGTTGVGGLRAFLAERLPDHMVPAVYVLLDRLPLMPNGKVDRARLPAPRAERPALESAYVEAATPLQRLVAGIWSETLGVEQVGVNDNFFDLGGDSLRAATVIQRVREATGSDVSLLALLLGPTVAELAASVTTGREEA
ncbi:MAG TPA: non-ribosomal peptide synthetase [Candidatus Dormibacteraeota bacterium]|nr:non-ribosomal peptide synthetase [Candidatus Dormibacteraeota bacterium]